jgi:hypothetical protein
MSYRPFRNIGRFLLAGCAVSVFALNLSAQTAASTPVNPSRVDIFAGYSGHMARFSLRVSNIPP